MMKMLLAVAELPNPEEFYRFDIDAILNSGFWWIMLVIAILAFISILFVIPPLELIIYPAMVFYVDKPHLIFAMIGMAVGMELLATLLAHKVGDKIGKKVLKRFYKEKQIKENNGRLDRWGPVGVAIFAATPLPVTVALYYAVAKKFKRKQLLIAMGAGRTIKYMSSFITITIIGLEPNAVLDWLLGLLGL